MNERRHKSSSLTNVLLWILSALVVTVILLGKYNSQTSPLFPCLTNSTEFAKALERQRRGLAWVRHRNGTVNANETWARIPTHFNKIWRQHFKQLHTHKLLSDEEEHKYFIPFSPNLTRPYECNVITLGIGQVDTAERNLSSLYPECRLVGVDPYAPVNADLMRAIGAKFVHAAVGAETAQGQPVNVFENEKDPLGRLYTHRQTLPQVGIFDFLRNVSMDPVDLLLIDVEGAEFGIIEKFVDYPEQIPSAICQLNVEVHFPQVLYANYTFGRFFDYLDTWLRTGQYALVHTDVHELPLNYLRLFLVNVQDEICIRKFLCR